MNKITNIFAFGVVLLGMIFFSSCKSDKLTELKKERDKTSKQIADLNKQLDDLNAKIDKLDPMAEQNPELVKTTILAPQKFEHYINIQSSVKTDQNVTIYPEFAGVLKLFVKEGQAVKAGQVIGEVTDGGLAQQLAQAKVQADLAQTSFKKQQSLWSQNIGSEIQFLQSKTSAEAAQKQVQAIQAQLGKTKIKAPFSGSVDKLITQNGQVVAPGMAILQLVNLGQMKIDADIPEVYIRSVRTGTPVVVSIPTIQQTYHCTVSKVGSSLNAANRTFVVTIPIPSGGGLVKPNLTADLDIIDYAKDNAIAVPSNLVKQDAQNRNYVYTYVQAKGDKPKAKKTLVEIGEDNGSMTEIRSGLNAGDILIGDGAENVVDGSLVKAVSR